MTTATMRLAQSFLLGVLLAVPAFAADEEALKKDLTAVIALHGLPCGEVIAVKEQAENDYIASCKDRNVYRVYMNADGRVIVEKRK